LGRCWRQGGDGDLRFDDEGSRRLVAAYLTPDVVAQRRSVRGWLEF
jgi:hypothetical protein